MSTSTFYEQSASSWMNEWAGNDASAEPLTDDEQEEEERAARVEMEQADSEAADYRRQEQEDWHSSRFSKDTDFAMDVPF